MTRDDIIRMALEAELNPHRLVIDRLERFAALVAAHEREECAKVCEDLLDADHTYELGLSGAFDCATAIRARGEK